MLLVLFSSFSSSLFQKKKRVSIVPLTGVLESYNSRNKMFFKPDFRESKTQYRGLDHVKLKQVTSFILK